MSAPRIWELHLLLCANDRDPSEPRPSCGRRLPVMEIVQKLKKRTVAEKHHFSVRVQKAGCFDLCEFGPVLAVYPAGEFYRIGDAAEAERVFDAWLADDPTAVVDLRIDPLDVPHVRRRLEHS